MKCNRREISLFRFLPIAGAVLGVLSLLGCVEPPYRNDVTATGQGGVVVTRVPKDADATSPTTPADTTEADLNHHAAMEERLRAMEKQLHEKDAEIERLKQQSTTAPAQ